MEKDYHAAILRAVSALDTNDREARSALYDRARHAMLNARLTASEIRKERIALEAAIRRVEAEFPAADEPAPSFPGAMARSPADATRAVQHTLASSRPAYGLRRLLIPGISVAMLLVVGLIGYAYWRKPGTDDIRTLAQPPAPIVGAGSADAPGDTDRSYIFKRQLVFYRSIHPTGTIVITKSQNFLYLIGPKTTALRYTIGVGQECASVVGLLLVSAKEDWTRPDANTLATDTQPTVRAVRGRFGARSLALGETGHRIHGSDAPVTSRAMGCFPLDNDDVIDLYERVALGTRVVMN